MNAVWPSQFNLSDISSFSTIESLFRICSIVCNTSYIRGGEKQYWNRRKNRSKLLFKILNFQLRISNWLTITQDIRDSASTVTFLKDITAEKFRIIPNILSQLFIKPSLQLLDMVGCLQRVYNFMRFSFFFNDSMFCFVLISLLVSVIKKG